MALAEKRMSSKASSGGGYVKMVCWVARDNSVSKMEFEEWLQGRCTYECAICLKRFHDR